MALSESKLIEPLLVSTWINSLLYAVVLVMGFLYFKTCKDDRKLFKALVAVCIAIDTACTCFEYVGVHLYTISHSAQASYLQSPNWTIGAIIICTGVTAILVQSFLVYKFFAFTRNRIATGMLTFLAFTTLVLSVVLGALGVTSLGRDWSTWHANLVIPVTLLVVFSAITNLAIAGSLVYGLVKIRNINHHERNTSSVSSVRRLVSNAIKSGFFPCVMAIVGLAVYFGVALPSAPIAVGFITGRTYTLTLLYNLTARHNLEEHDIDDSKSDCSISSFETPVRSSSSHLGLDSRLSFRPQTPMAMMLKDPESSPETVLSAPRYSNSPTIPAVPERVARSRPRTADSTAAPRGCRNIKNRPRPLTADGVVTNTDSKLRPNRTFKRTMRPQTADSALTRKSSYGSIASDPFGGGLGGGTGTRTAAEV